jgi:EmrB/QacA subfamily drug resistance transporter
VTAPGVDTATDPPAPSEETVPDAAHDGRRWVVLGVLCLSLLVVGIDGTIVNVALPTLVREIGASSSELQWIVDAYTIVFASFLLIAGNTGDRLGRKWVLLVGLVIFGAGSLACALVHSPTALIGTRAIQGFGAAFIMPATLSILTNVFVDPEERARAIAIWAGVSGLGVAIGPLVGGYLLEHFWWGSVFLVNVPLIIVAVIVVVIIVPNSKDPTKPKLDLLGTILSTVGLVGLLYGIIEGPGRGWKDPVVVAAFVVAAVLLTTFVLWERHTDHPILDVTFFKNPRFSAASVAVTLVFFAMFGALFFVSQYLQFVLGYSALESGIRLLPLAASLMIAAPLSAKLVSAFGTKAIVSVGLLIVAAALAVFSRAAVDSGYGLVAATLVLIGFGMGFAMAPATDSIMGSLPPARAGVGSAVNDTTREIGGALGIAILGSITTASYAAAITGNSNFALLQKASPEAAKAVKDSVGGAAAVAEHAPAQFAAAITKVANQAFVDALDKTVLVGAGVAVLGAIVALIWLPARAPSAVAVEGMDDLVRDTARSLAPPAGARRDVRGATLELLAEAGMSSLTFNGIAARSGIGTATLGRFWTSRIDAVVDAIGYIFAQHPIPDSGDLRADLSAYLSEEGEVLGRARSRAVIGTLIAEAAKDPDLEEALRARLVRPLQHELRARLEAGKARGELPESVNCAVAADLLDGPLYFRALITGDPPDASVVDPLLDLLMPPRR